MSIKGYTKGINNAALKQFINNYTARLTTVAAEAGKQAMRELRRSAVKNWYNSTAQEAMNKATYYESDPPKPSGDKIEITIRSYVNTEEFENYKRAASNSNKYKSPYENVRKWRERHEFGNRGSDGKRTNIGAGYWTYYDREPSEETSLRTVLEMPYTIGEYLFILPWKEGIVGLPPKARHTDTGWDNPKSNKSREPLESYANKYIKKRWDKTVQEYFDKLRE